MTYHFPLDSDFIMFSSKRIISNAIFKKNANIYESHFTIRV